MLPSVSKSERPSFTQHKLSVTNNNWIRYIEYWTDQANLYYGTSGRQFCDGKPIPLKHPSPKRNALYIHEVTGRPVPGQYIYRRINLSEQQQVTFANLDLDDQQIFLDNLPLTEHASAKYDRDILSHEAELDMRNAEDSSLLALLAIDVSEESTAALRLHADYAAYLHTEHRYTRSLLFRNMLEDIHKFGDASTKYHRTSTLILAKHDPAAQSFDQWVIWLNEHFAQFQVDFESDQHRGYIHCGELKSFLFLHGTDRATFRTVYDEQLRANPTGRFPDTSALIKLFQDHHRNTKMSMSDPISTQGSNTSAFAAPIAAFDKTKKLEKKKRIPCPHCLKIFPKTPRYGHLAHECSNRPQLTAAVAVSPSTVAVTQPAPLTDLARLDRMEQLMESFAATMSTIVSTSDPDPQSSPLAQTASMTTTPPHDIVSDRLNQIELALQALMAIVTAPPQVHGDNA